PLQEVRGGHDEARRAEPALQRVLLVEGLLHRVQGAVWAGQALDGGHLSAVGLDGEHEAGEREAAVDEHAAGAAGAMLAGEVHAVLAQLVAQGVCEEAARLDGDLLREAVDGELDSHRRHGAAARTALAASTPNAARRYSGEVLASETGVRAWLASAQARSRRPPSSSMPSREEASSRASAGAGVPPDQATT